VTVRELMDRILRAGPALEWLEPPAPNGSVTVRDVLASRDLAEHAAAVERWARDVWTAWSPHHDRVRGWLDSSM
jgi:hypothetical protein